MANRTFNEFSYRLEKGVVTLYSDVTIAAAGAPTLVSGKNKGIKSISRVSAGDYLITLQDSYVRLLMVDFGFIKATVPAAPSMSIKASSVTSNTAPTIEVVFYNSAGTATDPASGEELVLEIMLSNSSAI